MCILFGLKSCTLVLQLNNESKGENLLILMKHNKTINVDNKGLAYQKSHLARDTGSSMSCRENLECKEKKRKGKEDE